MTVWKRHAHACFIGINKCVTTQTTMAQYRAVCVQAHGVCCHLLLKVHHCTSGCPEFKSWLANLSRSQPPSLSLYNFTSCLCIVISQKWRIFFFYCSHMIMAPIDIGLQYFSKMFGFQYAIIMLTYPICATI